MCYKRSILKNRVDLVMKYLLTLFMVSYIAAFFATDAPTASIEARSGFFYFQDDLPRKIYGQGCLDLEIEGSYFLKKKLSIWANFDYNFASGSSLELSHATHLTMLCLSVGPKAYLFALDKHPFNPYLGVGVAGVFLKTTDDSPYVQKHLSRYKAAGVIKSGIFVCKGSICIDLFFDYLITSIKAEASGVKNPVNMGGFKTGIGMGYLF